MSTLSPTPVVSDVIDLARYPLDRANAERAELVERCRSQLLNDGVALLPGLLRPEAVSAMATEAAARSHDAYVCDDTHNVYLNDDSEFAPDHAGAPNCAPSSARLPTIFWPMTHPSGASTPGSPSSSSSATCWAHPSCIGWLIRWARAPSTCSDRATFMRGTSMKPSSVRQS